MDPCAASHPQRRRINLTAFANVLIGVVAILHLAFLALEMFFWDHPFGRKRFGMTPAYSHASASVAANQGLYNGFLATGFVALILLYLSR